MKIRFEELKTSFTSAISRRTYVQLFSMNSLKPWNTIKALRVVSVLYALFHIFFKKTRIISPISPGRDCFLEHQRDFSILRLAENGAGPLEENPLGFSKSLLPLTRNTPGICMRSSLIFHGTNEKSSSSINNKFLPGWYRVRRDHREC